MVVIETNNYVNLKTISYKVTKENKVNNLTLWLRSLG